MTMCRHAVVGWALAVLVSVSWSGYATAQSGVVRISDPKPGAVVREDAVDVSGTYSPKMAEDIWVLVWPAKAPRKFWPQSNDGTKGEAATKQDGKWTVQCALGGPPQKYEIAVYTANHAASKVLSDTLKSWTERDRYPGLTRLPEGLTEQARITIEKK